ncbi:MAG TPA: serine/threonine-protein kinase [Polyangiaceae bacterium]|nr:serine/threonine-protein kinase [Polyangiaceae bacterium]
MDFAPGAVVRDNVRLLRPLAEGAMGSVWVAEHQTLGTEVAVKFLARRDSSEALERFLREARTAARIKNQHVTRIFDQGVTSDGTPFIVMELLEGETLAARLERDTKLAVEETSIILSQLAEALEAAHRLGVVHRDIKPANVFLVRSDDRTLVKVIDFGIAKATELPPVNNLTGGGMMLGTPEYMSPEQVMSSRDVDYRADCWALAVVAYEMLTGARPFTGRDIGELCCTLLVGKFSPPSTLVSELPSSLDAWFSRALHIEPDERFASASAMANAFQDAVHETPPAPAPRRRVPLVALFGLMLVGVGIVAWRALAGEERASLQVGVTPRIEAPRPKPAEPEIDARSEEVRADPPEPSRPAPRSWHDRPRVEPKPRTPDEDDPGF